MPQTTALPPAILLMGPTASGKTACALALAPRQWKRLIRPHLAKWQATRPAQDTGA